MRNEDLIDWRKTTPAADSYPANIAEALDLASDLAAGSTMNFFWFRHADDQDTFDKVRLLEFVKEFGVHTTDQEKAEWDAVIDWVKSRQTPFMCKAEVELRLQNADGHCPMCGAEIAISAGGPEHKLGHHVMMRCQHFNYTHVDDRDAAVRRPRTWSGARWPWQAFSGRLLAHDDGQPVTEQRSDAAA
jgi:hypothetical protein